MVLIASIIFIGSILGIGLILVRKIPDLRELSLEVETPQESLPSRLKNRIRALPPIRSLSPEPLLHKLLSKGRVLTLKAENKISGWQNQLRQKSKKQKETEGDNYWEELKKSTDRKDKDLSA